MSGVVTAHAAQVLVIGLRQVNSSTGSIWRTKTHLHPLQEMRDPLQLGHSAGDGLDLLGGPEMLDEVEPRRHYRRHDASDSGGEGNADFRREHPPGRRGRNPAQPGPVMRNRLPLPFFYGWLLVAIGFVTMAVGVNARTAFSLLFPPILVEFGWDGGGTAGILSFAFLVFPLVRPSVARLLDR